MRLLLRGGRRQVENGGDDRPGGGEPVGRRGLRAQVLMRHQLLLHQQELMLLLQDLQGRRVRVVGQQVSHLRDVLLTLLQPPQQVLPDDPLVFLDDFLNIGHGRQLNCLRRCLLLATTIRVSLRRRQLEVGGGVLWAYAGGLLA